MRKQALRVFVLVAFLVSLSHAQVKCRGPVDVYWISDYRTEDPNQSSRFSEDQDVVLQLPEDLRDGLFPQPPDRYGWRGWSYTNTEGFDDDTIMYLTALDVYYSETVLDAVNFGAIAASGASAGPGRVVEDTIPSEIEEQWLYTKSKEIQEATRAVLVLRWDGSVGDADRMSDVTRKCAADKKCAIVFVSDSDNPTSLIDTLAGIAESDFNTEGGADGFPNSPNNFIVSTSWNSWDSAAVSSAVATAVNSTALWDAAYCDPLLYDGAVYDGFFDAILTASLVLLVGCCCLCGFCFFCLSLFCGGSKGEQLNVSSQYAFSAYGEDDEGRPLNAAGQIDPYGGKPPPRGRAPDSLKLAYFQALLAFEAWLQRVFRKCGIIVSSAPRTLMTFILVVSAVIIWFGFKKVIAPGSEVIERDMGKLWASPDSLALGAGKFLGLNFPAGAIIPRVLATLILEPADGGGNVLTAAHLESLTVIDEQLRAHPEYKMKDGDITKPTCYFLKVPTNCYRLSATDYWRVVPGSIVEPLPDDPLLEDFEDDAAAVFERTFSTRKRYTHGTPIFRNDVLEGPLTSYQCARYEDDGSLDMSCGGVWTDGNAGINAWDRHGNTSSHFRLTYFRLPSNRGSKDWFQFFDNYEVPAGSTLKITAKGNEDNLKSELNKTRQNIKPEMFVLTLAAIILFIFRAFASINLTRSRICLGLTGLVGTIMSIGAGIGGLVLLGDQISVTTLIVPVVILSIGVDDMFLIVDAFDETDPKASVNTRIADTMQDAGLAMTMTTMTDALAFGVGAFSNIPAVSSMSKFAMVCVLVDFAYQIFWFGSALVLDARRQKDGMIDCLCPAMYCTCCGGDYGGKKRKGHDSHSHEAEGFLGEYFGPLVVHAGCRWIIMIVSAVLLGIGIVSVTRLRIGLETNDLLVSGSELGQFLEREEEIFGEPVSTPVDLLHRNTGAEGVQPMPSEGAYLQHMDEFHRSMFVKHGLPGTTVSWWDAFKLYLFEVHGIQYPADASDFYSKLDGFRSYTYPNTSIGIEGLFGVDMNLENNFYGGTKITSIMLPLTNLGWESVTYLRAFYDDMRANGWAPFSTNLVLYEPNTRLAESLAKDIAYTLLIVFSVTILFLQHPSASFILVVTLMSVLSNVFILMWLFGIGLNTFTQVVLVIAMGLSIDYVSHIAHGFISSPGNRRAKAVLALSHHGPAIFNGMVTTAAGMIALMLLGHIELIRVFGKIVLIVQCVGLYHAFVVLPAALAWWGPLTFRNPVTAVLIEASVARVRPGRNGGQLDLAKIRTKEVRRVRNRDIVRADKDAVRAANLYEKAIRRGREGKSKKAHRKSRWEDDDDGDLYKSSALRMKLRGGKAGKSMYETMKLGGASEAPVAMDYRYMALYEGVREGSSPAGELNYSGVAGTAMRDSTLSIGDMDSRGSGAGKKKRKKSRKKSRTSSGGSSGGGKKRRASRGSGGSKKSHGSRRSHGSHGSGGSKRSRGSRGSGGSKRSRGSRGSGGSKRSRGSRGSGGSHKKSSGATLDVFGTLPPDGVPRRARSRSPRK